MQIVRRTIVLMVALAMLLTAFSSAAMSSRTGMEEVGGHIRNTAGTDIKFIEDNNDKPGPVEISQKSGNNTDVPTWVIGDWWKYYQTVTQNYTDSADTIVIWGNVTYTVSGIEYYDLDGSIFLAYNLTLTGDCVGQGERGGSPLYIDGKSSGGPDPTRKGDVYGYRIVRVSDLAVLYDEMHFSGYTHVFVFIFWLAVSTTVSFVIWDIQPIEDCDFLNRNQDTFWFDTMERRVASVDAGTIVNDTYDYTYPYNYTVNTTSNVTDTNMAGTFNTYYLNGTCSDPASYQKKWYSPVVKSLSREIRKKVQTSSTGYAYFDRELSGYKINQTNDTIFIDPPINLKNRPLTVWGNFNGAVNKAVTVLFPFTDDTWNTTTDSLGNYNVTITTIDRYDPTNTSIDNGSFGVTAYYQDTAGDRVVSTTLTLFDRDLIAPGANAGPDRNVDEDTPVLMDGSGSTDNIYIMNYTWNYTGPTGNNIYYGMTPIIVFDIPGTYVVTLDVTDIGNNTDTDILNVSVNDVTRPVAVSQGNMEMDEESLVTFDGSGSYDPEGGTILNYTWITGAIVLYGAGPSYTFHIPYNYSVTLEVKDQVGNNGTTTFRMNVRDITDPVADAGPDIHVNENTDFSFSAINSYDPEGGTLVEYIWTFPENSGTTVLNGVHPTYNIDTPGTYPVTLMITDMAGNNATDNLMVNVTDVTNPVSIPPLDLSWNEDSPVRIEDRGSYDPLGGGIASYEWTFNDGADRVYNENFFEYTFHEPGIYPISLKVTDNAGLTDTGIFNLTVLDITPPTAVPGENITVETGTNVRFNGSGSYDNVGISAYSWTFEYDGNTVQLDGMDPEYVFKLPGTYVVTLNVTDAAGNMGMGSILVSVNGEAISDSWPAFTSEPQVKAWVGAEWSYEPVAVDDDANDTVTISLETGPGGMVFESGILKWRPKQSQLGNNNVTLKATDGPHDVLQEFVIAVTDNRIPEISPVNDVTITAGKTLSLQIEATGPDGDTLTYSIAEGPDGLSIDDNGMITWNTATDDLGDHDVTVNVTARDRSAHSSFTVHVVNETVADGVTPPLSSTPGKISMGFWLLALIIIVFVVILAIIVLVVVFVRKLKQKEEREPEQEPEEEVHMGVQSEGKQGLDTTQGPEGEMDTVQGPEGEMDPVQGPEDPQPEPVAVPPDITDIGPG